MIEAMEFPLGRIWTSLLEALYPSDCELCGAVRLPLGADYLCETCRAKIRIIDGPRCLVCSRPLAYASGHESGCPGCREEKYQTALCRAACVYEGAIKDLLHAFKYGRKRYLRRTLLGLIRPFLNDPTVFSGLDGIIPVPMMRGRWLDRGFNQAGEIADAISAVIDRPVWNNALARVHHKEAQAQLRKDARQINIKNAFRVKVSGSVHDKAVLLVDDILTTGSTANECARVLKEAGAREVRVFVVARGL